MTSFKITPAPAPDMTDAAAGKSLFAGPCDFLKGVVAMDGLPDDNRIEVCFAGRSNVGKSSLINALTGRKALARTSNTPGRTQEINYFELGISHYLVDLPGYGFAKAPKDIVARWQNLMQNYLAGRRGLRRAFVLIDARHGIKQVDHEILSQLDKAAVTFQIVLTKIDKLKPSERDQIGETLSEALAKHPAAFPEYIATSSQKKDGLETLRAAVATIV